MRSKPIALAGVIDGGGMQDDGPGRLGVFLRYDPEDLAFLPHLKPRTPTAGCGPGFRSLPSQIRLSAGGVSLALSVQSRSRKGA